MARKPDVVVPSRTFYVTERRNGFNDWRFAFNREFIQNSVDAGAREIRISIDDAAGRGTFGRAPEMERAVRVRVQDDGTGMTRETLDNVFFSPGHSTKTSASGSIGGFGTARTMLCWSHDSYRVRTGNLVVEGSGAEYLVYETPEYVAELQERRAATLAAGQSTTQVDAELSELTANPTVKGCIFDIDLDPTEYGVSADRMREALSSYLGMSQLSAKVFLNGEEQAQGVRRGASRRSLDVEGPDGTMSSFGTVHISQSERAQHKGRIIVRVNGAAMFTDSTTSQAQVIIELDPARAREALTSSRDSMKGDFAAALRSFSSEFERDAAAAVQVREKRKSIARGGRGGFTFSPADLARPLDFTMQTPTPASDEDVEPLGIEDFAQLPAPVLAGFAEHIVGGKPSFLDGYADRQAVLEMFARVHEVGAEGLTEQQGTPLGFFMTAELNRAIRAATAPAGVDERNLDMHDIHIFTDDFEDKKVRGAIRRWSPDYWVRIGDKRAAPNRGMASHRFLTAWTVSVRSAFEAVARAQPEAIDGETRFATGFAFGKPQERWTRSGYKETPTESRVENEDGLHVLMVNPINPDGTPAYDIDIETGEKAEGEAYGTRGMRDLEARALADVCRVFENYYDRDYAELLTRAMATFDSARNRAEFAAAEETVLAAYGRGRSLVQAMDQDEPAPQEGVRAARKLRPAQLLLAHAAQGAAMVAGIVAENPDFAAPALDTMTAGIATTTNGVTEVDCDRLHSLNAVVEQAARQNFDLTPAPTPEPAPVTLDTSDTWAALDESLAVLADDLQLGEAAIAPAATPRPVVDERLDAQLQALSVDLSLDDSFAAPTPAVPAVDQASLDASLSALMGDKEFLAGIDEATKEAPVPAPVPQPPAAAEKPKDDVTAALGEDFDLSAFDFRP